MIVRYRLFPTLAPLVALLLASCSKDEPSRKPSADVPVSSAPASARVEVTPSIGGSVFFVGGHPVELAVYADGRVEGLVFDERGQEVAAERVAELTATLSVVGAAKPRVALRWDAGAKRFSGQAALEGELLAHPIDVSLQIDGKALTGALETYTLLPAADAQLEAEAVASAKAGAAAKVAASTKALADARARAPKLKAPKASAKADANLAVTKPRLGASAKASASADKTSDKKKAGVRLQANASLGL